MNHFASRSALVRRLAGIGDLPRPLFHVFWWRRAMEKLLPAVHAHLDAFVGNAEQFDDITMLALRFKGR